MGRNMNNHYDELNYNSSAFQYSSIQQLQFVSSLHGLNPSDLDNANVLEIGCSMGGNLFPAAIHYPNANFIGIDLSHSQINKGNLILEYMGMKNVKLLQKDVTTIDKQFGMFDYIICHGVYSWVPDFVKDAILAVCKNNLKENGVAYISYNTYPGWKFKDIVRDFMLYTNDYSMPLIKQVEQSFKNIDQIKDLLNFNGSDIMKNNYEDVQKHKPHYIAHEQFSPSNDPVYFHQFSQHINNYGLSFVAESDYRYSFTNTNLRKLISELQLDNKKDLIKIEQLHDFLTNRIFRQSIITHTKNTVNTNYSRTIKYSFINNIKIAANVTVEEIKDSDNAENNPNQMINFMINNAKLKENRDNKLLNALKNSYPNCLDLGKFFKQISTEASQEEIKKLYNNVSDIIYYCNTYLNISNVQDMLEIDENSKIKISDNHRGLAQYMIDFNDDISVNFSNYRYQNIGIDANLDKHIMIKMDGSLTQNEIIEWLTQAMYENKLGIRFNQNGEKVSEINKIKELSTNHVKNLIRLLQTNFLLI